MRIQFNCDYCSQPAYDRPSHYKRKKRHFCSQRCYSLFRAELLPKEEQHAYKGGGLSEAEKSLRRKARSDLNHAIRDGVLVHLPCESCGSKKSEGHHGDYHKSLEVRWLCKKCHWDEHRLIYENPDLLQPPTPAKNAACLSGD